MRLQDGPEVLREERSGSGTTVDLDRLLRAIKRQRKVLWLSVIIWCVLGMLNVLSSPKYYSASASVLLDSNINQAMQQISTSAGVPTTGTTILSAPLVITSDTVVGRVVDKLKLQDNAAFMNPPVSMASRMLGSVIATLRMPLKWLGSKVKSGNATSPATQPPSADQIAQAQREEIIQTLQQSLIVNRIGLSSAVTISYQSNDPKLAADIVNAFAQAYSADVLSATFNATEKMASWMQGQLTTLDKSARDAAQTVEAFRTQHGLVTTNARNATMSQDTISTLNNEISSAIGDAARAKAQVSALHDVVDRGVSALVANGAPAGLPPITDPDFQDKQRALNDLLATVARTKQTDGSSSSAYQSLELRVQNAANQLFAALKLQLEKAEGEAALANARLKALQESLKSALKTDAKNRSAQIQLSALEDRANALSTRYQTFLTKFMEVELQKSFPFSSVRVLNLAQVPRFAAGPSAKLALAISIVLGLLTGLIWAAIREWRDRHLYTAEQVIYEVGTHFLGYLPKIPAATMSIGQRTEKRGTDERAHDGAIPLAPRSPALEKPHSQYAETLRSIRLTSAAVGHSDLANVIAISSARPGEGKTTTSYSLASIIASGSHSVMLIDADPHRSGLSHLCGLRSAPGLLEVLGGIQDWRAACIPIGDTGVDLLPGIMPKEFSHVQEMLASEAFSHLIAELRQNYHFIILDLAPLGPISDVRAIIDNVDSLVIVAEWGKTNRVLLRRLVNSDPRIRKKLLGIALNRVDMKRLHAYSSEDDTASYMDDYSPYFTK